MVDATRWDPPNFLENLGVKGHAPLFLKVYRVDDANAYGSSQHANVRGS